MTGTQITLTLFTLIIIAPSLLYLCVKAFLRAKHEEKLEYLKKIKGDFNDQDQEKK